MGEQEGKKRDRFKTRKKIVLIREKYAYIHRNNAYIRCQGYIAIKLMIKRSACIPHRMERSWKGHVIAWKIKNILRAYSLVRRLCHDSKYRSLHSKPTLSHTSPFSSHRKDIRSRYYLRSFFRWISTSTQRPRLPLCLPLAPPPLLLCTPRVVHPHTPTWLWSHTTQLNRTTLHYACYLKPLQ